MRLPLSMIAVATLLATTACSNLTREEQRVLTGAAVGAAAGVAAGAVSGGLSVGAGAAIGTAAGAAAGFVYDKIVK